MSNEIAMKILTGVMILAMIGVVIGASGMLFSSYVIYRDCTAGIAKDNLSASDKEICGRWGYNAKR